jgi:hypothetical protein
MAPEAMGVARKGAKAAGITIGVWVAEAIQEKVAREAAYDSGD